MRSYHRGKAEPVGTLRMVAGANPPPGYLVCDGSTFDGGKYPRLADYLGGTTLPDYRDRALVGAGGSYAAGDGFGADSKSHGHGASTSVNVYNRTMSSLQMPSHDHGGGSHRHRVNYRLGTNSGSTYLAGSADTSPNAENNTDYSGATINTNGSDNSHNHNAGASTSVDGANVDVRQASRAATVCIRT